MARLSFVIILLVSLTGCQYKRPPLGSAYSAGQGYYYRLIAFENDADTSAQETVAWLNLSFCNQRDSVFWDSGNNFSDCFFARPDSTKLRSLGRHLSFCHEGDSVELLVPVTDFYREQFGSEQVPFFSRGDSVVKVYFSVKKLFSTADFLSINLDLELQERNRIQRFFGSGKTMQLQMDPAGFFWVERPAGSSGGFIASGDLIRVSYEGGFLDGRVFERSSQAFEFIYGTPDQVLPGLNNVIRQLKAGDNAKIVVPSRLAYGAGGSSNGLVPPFTPVLYQVRVEHVSKAPGPRPDKNS